jgi:uncharacterized repeat protein (TIGR01451 family)
MPRSQPRFVRSVLAALLAVGLLVAAAPGASAQSIGPVQPIGNLRPDLAVSVSASPATAAARQLVTYTATVRNIGQVASRDPFNGGTLYFNTPASGVMFQQMLPPGAVFRSASGDSGFGCAHFAGVVTCTGGAIPAAAAATITIGLLAPTTSGTFSGAAVVDPTNTIAERDEGNNGGGAALVVPLADLSISLEARYGQVEDGDSQTYYVHVDNVGPGADAGGVVVRQTLPAGATFLSAADGVPGWFGERVNAAGFACSHAAGVVTCSGGTVPSGQRGSFAVGIRTPRVDGQITSTATVDPNGGIPERDESNNSASRSTAVVGRPDLVVEARHQMTLALPLVWQRVITVRNTGPATASNVRVRIESLQWDYRGMAPDTYLSTVTGSGFACSSAPHPGNTPRVPNYPYRNGQLITCTGGTIGPGQSATLTVMHFSGGSDKIERDTIAVADPDGAIREFSESNNRAEDSWQI